MEDDKKSIAIGQFKMTLNLSNVRGIEITGVLLEGEDVDSVNRRLDEVAEIMDRQHIRQDTINKRAQIEQLVQTIEGSVDELERLTEKGKKKQLRTNEETNINNIQRNIQQWQKQVASLKAAIEEGERRLKLVA